jgi:hypothetical protein
MEEKEVKMKYDRVVDMDTNSGAITIKKPNSDEAPKEFVFDAVYDWK